MTIIHAGDVSYGFQVHKRVAGIFTAFINELVDRGYTLKNQSKRDDWGYNCRHIHSNPKEPWSNHAWGLAIDINADTNPNRSPLKTDMPAWVRQARPLMDNYGLRWGGTYHGTPDPMHLEFMGTPADADAITARLVKRGFTIVDAATKRYFEQKFAAIDQKVVDLYRLTNHGTTKAPRTRIHHEAIRKDVDGLQQQMNKLTGDLTNLQTMLTGITGQLTQLIQESHPQPKPRRRVTT